MTDHEMARGFVNYLCAVRRARTREELEAAEADWVPLEVQLMANDMDPEMGVGE